MMNFRDAKAAPLEKSLNSQLKAQLDPANAYENLSEEELFSPAEFDRSNAERAGYSNYSYWGATLRSFFKNKAAVFFLGIIVVVLAFSFIQPLLPGQRDPKTINNDPLTGVQIINRAPDEEYWFGTNSIGQDLWARTWAGTRTSLGIGFAVACFEALFGTFIGVLWGYVRKLDTFFT